MKITETCSCGASFEIDADHDSRVYVAERGESVNGITIRDAKYRAPWLPEEEVRLWRATHHHTPAPAGVPAAPTSRDRPIGPAGAPLYSEDRCDNGHVLDCCGNCKCEGTQHE